MLEEEIADTRKQLRYWQHCAMREHEAKKQVKDDLSRATLKSEQMEKQLRRSRQQCERLYSISKDLRARVVLSNQCLDQLILCTDRVRSVSKISFADLPPCETIAADVTMDDSHIEEDS